MVSRQGEQGRDAYPASPCNSTCTLDDDGRCLGCKRTLDEIVRWSLMNADEQWAVIAEIRSRR